MQLLRDIRDIRISKFDYGEGRRDCLLPFLIFLKKRGKIVCRHSDTAFPVSIQIKIQPFFFLVGPLTRKKEN